MGQAATRGAARRRARLTRLSLPRSVHQRLRPVGDDFRDERGRPGDADPGDDVVPVISRRDAHWVHSVTVPAARTLASSSPSGTA